MHESAELIFSGDELLRGDTLNTNQFYLTGRLVDLGFLVTRTLCVRDDLAALSAAIRESIARRPRILVLSGGLGPTEDDLTREAVSSALKLPLEHHDDLLVAISDRFLSRGLDMSDTNRKQALLPRGAQALPFSGTAPGFVLATDDTLLVALPGVPWELKEMWEEHAGPLVRRRAGAGGHVVRRIRTFGLGESVLAQMLADLDWSDPSATIGTRADLDGITVILRGQETPEGTRKLDSVQRRITGMLGGHVYSLEGEDLPTVLGGILRDAHLTVGVAESCTGGLLGKLLTDVPGSSEYFLGGVTAYDNRVKTEVLRVPEETLAAEGAVSEQVAAAMAEGICGLTGSHCGLATTGIAGPGGGSEEKPVGLVYVASTSNGQTQVERLLLFGGRERVRGRAAFSALDLLRRRLAESSVSHPRPDDDQEH